MGNFWDFIVDKLLGASTAGTEQTIDLKDLVDKGKALRLALYELALHAGVNLIANIVSLCEVRTFSEYAEIFGSEYYLWNYAPNANQNAAEFRHRLVERLLLHGECLVVPNVKGELLIAESYKHDAYALFPDMFSAVTVRGSQPYTFQRTFRADEVMFYKLHNQPLAALLRELEAEYSELVASAVAKFQKGGGERGVLTIDANMPTRNFGNKPDGTPRTFNDVYAEMMTKQFKDYFKSPNAVMTLWDGFSYETKGADASKKSTSDVKDITDLRDQVYDAVATALLIPPAILKGSVANTEDLRQDLLTNAVDPVCHVIQTENNRKRNGEGVLHGTYQSVDTTNAQHIDVFAMATNIDKLVADGVLNVDEIRRKIREPEIREPWSRAYTRTKNYEAITNVPESGTE